MIQNNLLLCLFGIFACFIASSVSREAIIGGHKAEANQFRYLASVQLNDLHRCGGSIIAKELILTCAHCVIGYNGRVREVKLTVLVATNDLARKSYPALIYPVYKVYVPIEFQPMIPAFAETANLAILKIRGELPLRHTRHFKALQLPRSGSDTYENDKAKFSGFGWTWINFINRTNIIGGINDTQLRWANADVLPLSDPAYIARPGNSDRIIYARLEQSEHQTHGVCWRDIGGPLVFDETVLIGVLNAAPLDCSERVYPGSYTRITKYLTFIRNVKLKKLTNNIRVYELVDRPTPASVTSEQEASSA